MRRGPVAPTAAALGILRALPLDAVHLEPRSVLGGWQVRNRDATIPHALDRLESSGALANLRRVLTGEGDFAGEVFADSDVHKTLEAMGWDAGRAAQDPDGRPAWAQEATALVDLLEQVQDEDGYLGSWCQGPGGGEPWADLRRGHEMYCAGHLIQAGVAWARTTGDTRLLTVARRFADLLVRRFGAGAAEAVCGHPQIETALVELFRTTGERTYLDLARRMIDLRGRGLLAGDQFGDRYLLDHTPVRELTQATGHAVRMLYLATGATDVAVEDRDEALLATMQRLWQDAFGTKTYITGGQGSRHRDESFGDAYELPSDRAYAETCAAIAAFHWSWRLLLATGDPRYADAMEHLLHNAIAVATAEDGRHFFYSNPLQLRPEHDGSQEDAPSQRLSWYRCACCPPNVARLMASLHGYVATGDAAGVQLHLLAATTVEADVEGLGAVGLEVTTDYPWDGRLEVRVTRAPQGPAWELAVRVPAWARGATASVGGTPVAATPGGYLRVTREWRAGDRLVLDLPLRVRAVHAHPRVDAARGSVALLRGPLVHCLEQTDHDEPIDDLRLDLADLPRPVATGPAGGPAPVVLRGTARIARPRSGLYVEQAVASRPGTAPGEVAPGRTSPLVAVPYATWANRAPGAMRVWVPVATATTPRTVTRPHDVEDSPCSLPA